MGRSQVLRASRSRWAALTAVVAALLLTGGPSVVASPRGSELEALSFIRTLGPTTALAPASVDEVVTVSNTSGEGANLRAAPSTTAAVRRIVPEGETLVVVGANRSVEGRTWRNVRDGEGTVGWIAASLLGTLPTAPTLASSGTTAARTATTPRLASPAAHPGPQVEATLLPAWNAVVALEGIGSELRDVLETSGVRLTFGVLPRDVYGTFRPQINTIVVSRTALREDPRALAAVLAHEMTHVKQVQAGLGAAPGDCVQMEVEAFDVTARVWSASWSGSAPARTQLERNLNALVELRAAEGDDGFASYVINTPGYQSQCGL